MKHTGLSTEWRSFQGCHFHGGGGPRAPLAARSHTARCNGNSVNKQKAEEVTMLLRGDTSYCYRQLTGESRRIRRAFTASSGPLAEDSELNSTQLSSVNLVLSHCGAPHTDALSRAAVGKRLSLALCSRAARKWGYYLEIQLSSRAFCGSFPGQGPVIINSWSKFDRNNKNE